ncbi:TetR/AcrR family transcriptional regulator [Nocardioides sp. ChNu-153]|uniref:TetR/AcrR family transcriptional regulator n=1 Tax=unclassified Nocardioides TaxID=2615069 RepID=UPI002405990E|nr:MULTISPECIES: TetR/AcrR family transcriptional regulator [unclassified Nocardioides]MDF9714718.1 TetR/AcrR family transcriptional regulator [Nocardioides sp. ChNu-99]MDN7120154.1 TetR/AcrR family transcriptional regulator [Nocardioides sp. ChNu-153]
MSKPPSSKRRLPGLPSVPGTNRRAQYSASTKRALVDVAERLFAEEGYAGASLDAIVAGAEVTKGALYHHFHGKRALFEAVFERVEGEAVKAIQRSMGQARDPWDKALAGLRAFVDVVQQPAYRRVVVQEGPAVLGYERIREQQERTSFALVHDMVADVLADPGAPLDDLLLSSFSSVFFGALSAAGEFVADSDDPGAASRRVEVVVGYILSGMQLMRDGGVALPTTEQLDEPEALEGEADPDGAPPAAD